MSNTVYDAIILGPLSLSSMLGSMFFKQKSFFFVGAGVLLLNLLLQTKLSGVHSHGGSTYSLSDPSSLWSLVIMSGINKRQRKTRRRWQHSYIRKLFKGLESGSRRMFHYWTLGFKLCNGENIQSHPYYFRFIQLILFV